MDEKTSVIFMRAFSTPDGQRVIEKINRRFREKTDLPLSDREAYYERGQRSVIEFINREIERGGKVDGASTE